jgi:hypothetical protein
MKGGSWLYETDKTPDSVFALDKMMSFETCQKKAQRK